MNETTRIEIAKIRYGLEYDKSYEGLMLKTLINGTKIEITKGVY